MPILKSNQLSPFGVELSGWELNKEGAEILRSNLMGNSLVVIRNFKVLSDQELTHFAAQLSFQTGELEERILHWEFGPVMRMAYDPQAKNYLFSEERVPFHWDGAFHREPQFLVFYCEESEGAGGETLFANTELILNDMPLAKKRELQRVRLTYSTEKVAHYGGRVTKPLLHKHPLKCTEIMRFAESVNSKLNPVDLEISSPGVDPEALYGELTGFLYNPQYCYTHCWRKGDLVIADNFSLVHGRNELNDNKRRVFKRVQVL